MHACSPLRVQASGIMPPSVQRRPGRPPHHLVQCRLPQGAVRKGQPPALAPCACMDAPATKDGWPACRRRGPVLDGEAGERPLPQRVLHREPLCGSFSRRPTRWHPPLGGSSCPARPRRARCTSGLTCSATWQAASRTVQALRRATLGWPRRPGMQSRMGCDPQVRLPDDRYVPLQFKRPPSGGGMSITAPSRQASALLKICPASSSLSCPRSGRTA